MLVSFAFFQILFDVSSLFLATKIPQKWQSLKIEDLPRISGRIDELEEGNPRILHLPTWKSGTPFACNGKMTVNLGTRTVFN